MSGGLAFLGIAEAAELIRAKKLSPVEYMKALLGQIERHDGKFNAFITVTPERALTAARAAEAEITAGKRRGPFHGMPYALNDIIDVEGIATTAHSKVMTGNAARRHAVVTERLETAGGVLLGKLSTHEFAIGGPSFDLPWPPARNPWNRDHFCGGSSSGSGAGLAAGFFPAALGTDTGGSIRNPASMCGIAGMKPTYGRVSRRGVAPLAYSLDHVGPMTRTVRDNALMLQVIAGHDPGDPGSADEPVPDYTSMLGHGVKGLRIGVIRHFYTTDVAGDPEQVEAIDAAVSLFAKAGAEISEITLPPLQDFSACGQIILAAEAYAVHEPRLKKSLRITGPGRASGCSPERRCGPSTISRRCAGGSSSVMPWQRPLPTSTSRSPRRAWTPPAASTTRQRSPPITRARRGCRSTSPASRGWSSRRGSPQPACRCRCSSSAVHSRSRCSTASPNSTRTPPAGRNDTRLAWLTERSTDQTASV